MFFRQLSRGVTRLSFLVARQSVRVVPINGLSVHRLMVRPKAPKIQPLTNHLQYKAITRQTIWQRPTGLRSYQAPSVDWSRVFSWVNGETISFAFLSASVYALYQLISDVYAPREIPIIAKAIHHSETLSAIDGDITPEHGTLNLEVLAYQDKKFLKKGAASREKLLREFVIGDVLNAMYSIQPMTLLYHEAINENQARYYTLSEIKPGSMDFADFIKAGDWQDKLAKKPLKGFERALAMVGLMAGQQDCKFANLVIIEKESHYEAVAIDFELSGERYISINKRQATNSFEQLTSMIRDLWPLENDQFGHTQHFELTNDPSGKAFIEYVKEHSMNREALDDFYQRAVTHDYETTLEKLEALQQETDLVKALDITHWRAEFKQWQDYAQKYCDENQVEKTCSLVS
jgi:hypothetical protein